MRTRRVCFRGLIVFEFERGASIKIGMPLRLKAWSHERTFHPQKLDTLQPVLSLVGNVVVSATVAEDGPSAVQLDDGGTQLHVDDRSTNLGSSDSTPAYTGRRGLAAA